MVYQRLPILTRMLVAIVVILGSTLPCAGHGGGGHGGGGGHALGGYGVRGCPYGFRGGYGYGFYRYPGFFGYPWYGFGAFGLGLGLGYGLGYGFGGSGFGGYGLGYNYPPYYPYGGGYGGYAGGYPGYAAPVYTPPPPPAAPLGYPAVAQGPAPGAPAGPVPGGPMRLTDTDMLLSIRVPPNAVVRINGERTNQYGPRREFMSTGLTPGRTYTYVVTAQWTAPNGQAVEQERRVQIQGGERRNVDFLITPASAQDLR